MRNELENALGMEICEGARIAIRNTYGGDAALGWKLTDHVEWMLFILYVTGYFRGDTHGRVMQFIEELVPGSGSKSGVYLRPWISKPIADKIREYIPEWPI